MHPGKISPDTERYNWIRALVDSLYIRKPEYNLAIHVNNDWCEDICNGIIPAALEPLFNASSYYKSRPLVQRIQLNMPKHTAENVADNLTKIKSVAGAYDIWIDAEGKLKRDDKFDVNRAKQYIQNALKWDEKQR